MGSDKAYVHANVHGACADSCANFKQVEHSDVGPFVVNPNSSAIKNSSSTEGTKVVFCIVKSDKVLKGGRIVVT